MKNLMVLFSMLVMFIMPAMDVQAQVTSLSDEFPQPTIPKYVADKTLSIAEVHARIDADTSFWFTDPGIRDFAKGMAYAYRGPINDNPMIGEFFKDACKASSPDWSRPHPVYLHYWLITEGGRWSSDKQWVSYLESTCPSIGAYHRAILDDIQVLIDTWDDLPEDTTGSYEDKEGTI